MNYHGGVASIMHSSLRESCENIDHEYEEFTAVFINETHTLLYFQALIDMPCKSCHLTPYTKTFLPNIRDVMSLKIVINKLRNKD